MPSPKPGSGQADPPRRRGRPHGSKARYMQIVEDLIRRMDAREWRQTDPLPSLRQLAQEYGVGVQVIRSALSHLVREDRVAVTPRRRIVLKNPGHLTSATANLVALILSYRLDQHWQNPAGAQIQRGIEVRMGRMTDPLLIVHHFSRLKRVIPPDLLNLPLRGILLYGQFEKAVLGQYEKLPCPVALVDQPPGTFKLSSACVDNANAAREAVLRLLELGHRRIAFLRFIPLTVKDIDPDSKERELGYLQGFAEWGLKPPARGIFNTFAHDTTRSGAIQALLEARPPFSAVLTADPTQAHLLLRGLAERGLAVPRNMSVAVFQGNASGESTWSGPRVDFEGLGSLAVDLLEEAKRQGRPVCRRIPAPWRDGGTTGPWR